MDKVHTPRGSDNSEPYDATAEDELLSRYGGLQRLPDQQLIDLIDDERVALMGDADEATAAAAVILQRRLDGILPRIP